MTTKQIAEVAGVSPDTALRKIKELYPEKVRNGRPVSLVQHEAVAVMAELRKIGFVAPQNAEVAPQNAKVVTHADLAMFAKALIGEMMREIIPLVAQPRQIDFVQDYFTIKGYANKLGISINYSDAIGIGRAAAKLSAERHAEIRKADDERFGQVNSYHVSVLREVFQA